MKSALKILLVISLIFIPVKAFAAGFTLTYIGAIATAGQTYNHWWYTVTNPTLKGTADPSAIVTVTIDSTAAEVTADTTGNWSYPTTLASGDHQISLASSGSTYTFTLTIGLTVPANIASQSGTTAPNTGYNVGTLFMIAGSALAIFLGARLLKIKLFPW